MRRARSTPGRRAPTRAVSTPRSTICSARPRLAPIISSIRSSIVPAQIMRCTCTTRVWPMRCARSDAWSPTAGFHQRSTLVDVLHVTARYVRCTSKRRPKRSSAISSSDPLQRGIAHTAVTLLDRATIGVLAEVLLHAERRATEVQLVAAPGSAPDRILTIVGLSQSMNSTYPTREAVLEAWITSSRAAREGRTTF